LPERRRGEIRDLCRARNEGRRERVVPPAERIAVFDNDGTLCCEQPLQIQFYFAFDPVKELAAKDPALAERQPFKAVLEHDYKYAVWARLAGAL
jgi:hypothetical protein